MLIKTLPNKVERFKSFVYGSINVQFVGGVEALIIDIEPRRIAQFDESFLEIYIDAGNFSGWQQFFLDSGKKNLCHFFVP